MRRATGGSLAVLGLLAFASSAAATVLRVGTYHGIRGQYRTIQAAVDAAKPGDWVLVAPGDYKTAPTDHYPRETRVQMHPLPPARQLPTMPHPCQGVPRNPWCGGGPR
jgi:hypothetical protein